MDGEYLKRLPSELQYAGSHKDLEIELRETDSADSGILYEDKYVLLLKDPVIFPNGRAGYYVRLVEAATLDGCAGTVIIPYVDHCVVFVEIFRHATRRWEWELPRGFQEKDHTPDENAIKETKEELGVLPESVVSVGCIASNTGLLSGTAEAFIAYMPSGCTSFMKGQELESIRSVKAVHVYELDPFLLANVRCGFSLSAILLAKLRDKLT